MYGINSAILNTAVLSPLQLLDAEWCGSALNCTAKLLNTALLIPVIWKQNWMQIYLNQREENV